MAETREGPKVLEPRLYKMIMGLQFELAENLHRADSTGIPSCVEWMDTS